MISFEAYKCKHCGTPLQVGCACMVCPKCKKLFLMNGEEIKEDGSNFFIKPSEINWSFF